MSHMIRHTYESYEVHAVLLLDAMLCDVDIDMYETVGCSYTEDTG